MRCEPCDLDYCIHTLEAELKLMTEHAKEGWDLANERTRQWKQTELQKGELEDQIAQAYSKMGKYAHEAFGWEKQDNWTYAFSIGKFIEIVNEKYERMNRLNGELRKALEGFVDEECHCTNEGVEAPCVQCVARAALSDKSLKRVVSSPTGVCPHCCHQVDDPAHRPCMSSDNRK